MEYRRQPGPTYDARQQAHSRHGMPFGRWPILFRYPVLAPHGWRDQYLVCIRVTDEGVAMAVFMQTLRSRGCCSPGIASALAVNSRISGIYGDRFVSDCSRRQYPFLFRGYQHTIWIGGHEFGQACVYIRKIPLP